jgi:outer membrane autotransporter protein
MRENMKQLALIALLFSMLITPKVRAENWQNIVQPKGYLERLWNAQGTPPNPLPTPPPVPTVDGVNSICIQWDPSIFIDITDPFEQGTLITEIQPTQLTHFVRFYTPAAGGTPYGAWIMFPSEVRGLTAVQLRDKFALPVDPSHIVSVDIPPSPTTGSTPGKKYGLWTGIADPIWLPANPPAQPYPFFWGHGGGVQTRIMADAHGTTYFPDYIYPPTDSNYRYHQQPLGVQALSYKPLAGTGNTLRIATYLDAYVPQPYSDLETVYFALDYLNWNNPTLNTKQDEYTAAFQEALNNIGPEKYSALPFISVRNSIVFDTTLFDRFLYQNCNACCTSSCHCRASCPTVWVYGLGEIGKLKTIAEFTGFKYKTGGAIAGIDYQPRDDFMFGACCSGISNSLHWQDEGGHGKCANFKAGLYSRYFPSCFFIDGILSGGYTWSSTARVIEFPAIDAFGGLERSAYARPRGHDVELAIQSGYKYKGCWCATPLARLSYFYNKQHHFIEHGAESLDLDVQPFSNQTLRLQLGGDFMRSIETSSYALVPQFRFAWARDFFLDHRVIESSLNEIGNSFDIVVNNNIGNRFLIGAGLTFKIRDCFNFFAQYDAEINKKFTSQIINGGFNWVF